MVMYFANPSTPAILEKIHAGYIGFIDTPLQGNVRPPGIAWCADNGCFGKGFNEDNWWGWLQRHAGEAGTCWFATAPDVVGDAEATLARSRPWLPRIRALGYRAAYVAQDGSDEFPPPWGEFDVLFLGGTTEFKLGPVARELVAEGRRRGVPSHMGRVNSHRRYRYAETIGCASVDGTHLTFAPDRTLPELLGWVRSIRDELPLFHLHDEETLA